MLAVVAVTAVALLFTVFGLGGGILYLPLIYGLGASYRVAASTALALNVAAGGAASIEYLRRGQSLGRVVFPAVCLSLPVAPLASYLAARTDVAPLRWAVAGLLALAAVRFTAERERSSKSPERSMASPIIVRPRWQLGIGLLLGAVNGVTAGLLGIGGGVVTAPVLLALGATPLCAAATTAPIVVAASLAGLVGHLLYGVVDFHWIEVCVPAAIVGGVLGARVHRFRALRPAVVRRSLGLVLGGAAVIVGSSTALRADPYDLTPLSRTVAGIERLARGEGPGVSPAEARALLPVLDALVRLRLGGTLSPEAAVASSAHVLEGFAMSLEGRLGPEQRTWVEAHPADVRGLKRLSTPPFDLLPSSPYPRVRDVPPLDLWRVRWWRARTAVQMAAYDSLPVPWDPEEGSLELQWAHGAPRNGPPAAPISLPVRFVNSEGRWTLASPRPRVESSWWFLTLWVDGDGDGVLRRGGADFGLRRIFGPRGEATEVGRYVGRVNDVDFLADDQSLWRWSAGDAVPMDRGLGDSRPRVLLRLEAAQDPHEIQVARQVWQWPRPESSVLDPTTWGVVGRSVRH